MACSSGSRAAKPTRIYSARHARASTPTGNEHDALALNEVSLFRTTYQAVKVEIMVDGRTQMEELICDGVLLVDARRLDRLQSVGPRPDPADRRAAAGADADLAVPAAALARRDPRQHARS